MDDEIGAITIMTMATVTIIMAIMTTTRELSSEGDADAVTMMVTLVM